MFRMTILAGLLLLPLAAAAQPSAPEDKPPFKTSFDCTRTKSNLLQMVCNDKALAALDLSQDEESAPELEGNRQPLMQGEPKSLPIGTTCSPRRRISATRAARGSRHRAASVRTRATFIGPHRCRSTGGD